MEFEKTVIVKYDTDNLDEERATNLEAIERLQDRNIEIDALLGEALADTKK